MSRLPLVILSAGGTAQDAADFIQDLNAEQERYELLGFLDDAPTLQGQSVMGFPVLGPLAHASHLQGVHFVDALGSPRSFRQRRALLAEKGLLGLPFETLVHPLARVSKRATVGAGSLIYPLTFIGAEACLGEHVIVLSNSAVNHHARLGDYTIVTSNVALSGHVTIGSACYLGTGSCVLQGLTLGNDVLVGMGSVVRHDLPAGCTAYGNPARLKPHA